MSDVQTKVQTALEMTFNTDLEPTGKKGKCLTILSIDGGGVRGIIPAKILEVLEDEIRNREEREGSKETRHDLWEYFDMIAGTSSGGLITAMITTRTGEGSKIPCCNATEVVKFFEKDAENIFPTKYTDSGRFGRLSEGFASIWHPIYKADTLEALLEEKFRNACLSEALTSVIIPAFDTEIEVPVFFSNLKGVDRAKPLYNVQVKDACRATTAVPILFPAANFNEVSGNQNKSDGAKEFHVIDGGIAVNDPTLVAVTQAIAEERQAIAEEPLREGFEIDSLDFSNILVLSLGTGQHPMRFLGMPQWSSVNWLLSRSGSPLLNSFLCASEEMVEYYTSMIFDAHGSGHHYLRIQTDGLSISEFWGIDDARKENLDDLKRKADKILTKAVSKRNFATGELHAIPGGGNNEEALRRFARWLVEERRERIVDSDKTKQGHTGEIRGKYVRIRSRSPP